MGINGLDLIKLNAFNNSQIRYVSWMKNLKELDASYESGINQLGIKRLDLNKLDVCNNPQIIDVSFMKNLKELHASVFQEYIKWESKN